MLLSSPRCQRRTEVRCRPGREQVWRSLEANVPVLKEVLATLLRLSDDPPSGSVPGAIFLPQYAPAC